MDVARGCVGRRARVAAASGYHARRAGVVARPEAATDVGPRVGRDVRIAEISGHEGAAARVHAGNQSAAGVVGAVNHVAILRDADRRQRLVGCGEPRKRVRSYAAAAGSRVVARCQRCRGLSVCHVARGRVVVVDACRLRVAQRNVHVLHCAGGVGERVEGVHVVGAVGVQDGHPIYGDAQHRIHPCSRLLDVAAASGNARVAMPLYVALRCRHVRSGRGGVVWRCILCRDVHVEGDLEVEVLLRHLHGRLRSRIVV